MTLPIIVYVKINKNTKRNYEKRDLSEDTSKEIKDA